MSEEPYKMQRLTDSKRMRLDVESVVYKNERMQRQFEIMQNKC